MSKEINFMRKDLLKTEEMEKAIQFLKPVFENDGMLFKEMIKNQQAMLESNRFTVIKDSKNKKVYRIMGNCIGPILYVKEILELEE